MAEAEYRRLTRARSRTSGMAFTVNSSLWIGADHLLSIDTTGYSETYKRFHFRDIQAFIAQQNRRRLWAGIVLGAFTTMFVVIAAVIFFAPNPSAVAVGIFAGLALLCGGAAVVNFLKGPGCVCYIRTAVQIDELPSVTRISRFHRLLEELRPLIVQAQGELPAAEIPARMQQLASAPAQAYVVDDPNLPPRML